MKTKLLLLVLFVTVTGYTQTINLELVAGGFSDPVEITHAGDDRLFVVEQGGVIKILNADGTTNPTPFLNISGLISTGSERGLLGLAFHPDYEDNGYFYVNYTNTSGDTVIARYSKSTSNDNEADPDSALELLTIDQPFSNHNGGCLRFGSDGYLYISTGDGGSGGDPNNNGQRTDTLLGKLLRLDVDNGDPYGIPATNPFFGTITGEDEIWAYGLRNAWKFSFNRLNGDLWIADVGQGEIEEINKITANVPGMNFGWRCFEGSQEYNPDGCSIVDMYIMPFAEYNHDNGACSVTGGYVYTGDTYPGLQGKYLFADYCNNRIGMVGDDGVIEFTSPFAGNNFTTFGEDIDGELYIGGSSSGNIYRIVDAELGVEEFGNEAFTIYPNPAIDIVYIEGTGAGRAQIYDLSGKLLSDQELKDTNVNAIATSNLPSGFYILNITGTGGGRHNYKLTIQ